MSFQLQSARQPSPITSRNERERRAFAEVRKLIERGNDMLILRVTSGALTVLGVTVLEDLAEQNLSALPVARRGGSE